MLILFSFLSAYKDRNKNGLLITVECSSQGIWRRGSATALAQLCQYGGTGVPMRWHSCANLLSLLAQCLLTESGPIGYFFVIRNQSTSVHPPSLVTIAGRVQNMPTLVPIHCPSLAWKGLPNGENFFPSRL